MSKGSRILIFLCLLAIISGCAPNLYIKKDFFDNKEKSIGVALAPYPEGSTYVEGNQGVIGSAITDLINQNLTTYLKSVNIESFGSVQDDFIERFKSMGFNAVKINRFVDDRELSKIRRNTKNEEFMEKYKIDTLVVLKVNRFGTFRRYIGFIPLDYPDAIFEVEGKMIDLETGKLIWRVKTKNDEARVPVAGEWNQPPDYKNVTNAIILGMENGKKFLLDNLFNRSN